MAKIALMDLDYTDPETVQEIIEIMKTDPYSPSCVDGNPAEPTIQSISLPCHVWDDIFQCLASGDKQAKALSKCIYPEDGPLDSVKNLISGPHWTNMVTLSR